MPLTINQDLKALTFITEVNSEYISYFFEVFQKYVFPLITKQSTTVQSINTEQFIDFKIPIPPIKIQNKIVELMNNAYNVKKQKEQEAEKLLNSIDSFVLEQLGIKLPEKQINKIFKATAKELFNNRFDPLKFQTFYSNSLKQINNGNFNTTKLYKLINRNVSGEWGEDEEKQLDFKKYTKCLVIRATEIDNKFNLNIENSRKKYRYINNLKLKTLDLQENDILIEKSGGSENQPVGRVAILTKELLEKENVCFSNFLQKIRLGSSVDSSYVYCVLKTFYNKKITENMQSQTNGIRNLIMREFINIPIPIPEDIEIQNKIANEVKNRMETAKQLKKEAVKIVENAKNEVERMILGEE